MPEILSKKAVAATLKGFAQSMKITAVMDGFRNLVTGVGTSRSKVSAGEYVDDPILDFYTLEGLFANNDLAATIVQKPVEDALRAGFWLESTNDDDEEALAEVLADWEALGATDHVQRAGVFGRLKGGAGVILGTVGGGDLSSKLDEETVTELEFLTDWDAQDMVASSYYPDGTVETYLWNPAPQLGQGPSPQRVHETRLVKFPGVETSSRKRQQNRGWDLSVLQRVYSALRSFDGMFGSTDAMFADASQAVFKLQGLIQTLAEASGTGSADVQTRLQVMDLMRSSTKAIVLDAGDETGRGEEDFSVVDRSTLGGLDGVMNVYLVRLAAAARMPLTVLLGMSPAGMDATGESDMILYYNTVDVYRLRVLTPRILRMIRMLARAKGHKPENWKICWPELARPKPLDVRTAENMAITSAMALVTGQVVVPEELALCLKRVARDGVSALVLDTKSRKKRLKDALSELEDGELGLGQETALIEAKGEQASKVKKAGPAEKMSERKTPSKAAKKQV